MFFGMVKLPGFEEIHNEPLSRDLHLWFFKVLITNLSITLQSVCQKSAKNNIVLTKKGLKM